jgi:peptide/nickel transport system ATP-binding protein
VIEPNVGDATTCDATARDAIVTVEELDIAFADRTVVHGVSFEIRRGEALALVGESGSGKTVTARALTGSIGNIGGRVIGGRVWFDGEEIVPDDEAAWSPLRGRRVAVVPQASLSSLDPIMRVGQQLVETIRHLDPGADVEPRAHELLDHVRMPRIAEVMRSYPHGLSGGMRQRVMIALALAGRPDVMVADEPTTALDVTVQASILELLNDLRRDEGMSLLIIAHDLAVVGEVAERVAVMRDGRLVEIGDTSRVLTEPDDVYTAALLAARPETVPPGAPLAVLDRTTGALRRPSPVAVPTAGSDVIARCSQVELTYRGASAPAVAPVDLEITEGSAIGIVGESGSGKTTLGRMLVGVLDPTAGTIEVGGRAWSRIKRKDELRGRVQMIFQDPYGSLTPWRTARQIVGEVVDRWERSMTSREALRRAGELLEEVGLDSAAADRFPTQLSGGQCQRIGIARALAPNPSLLVADEPTSSLDISTQAQILNLILGLRADRGLALVLISHDLTVVRHMTSTALVMRGGIVVERGDSTQIFDAPEHEYTRRLLASTPQLPTAASRPQIVESMSITNGRSPGPAPSPQARSSARATTASSWRT